MTPDELIERAKLMIRYAESVKAGKPIQLEHRWAFAWLRKESDKWYPVRKNFRTFREDCEYREKPAPLECWVNVYQYKDGPSYAAHDTLDEAERACCEDSGAFVRTVHMREVEE